MSNEIPSKDPASDATMGGMLRSVFAKMLQAVDGMLPATVVSYNRTTNIAVIQPTIDILTTGGTTVRRATYAAIPVLAIGGGGFCITFPLKPGDTGWIEASDRDISLWQQSGRNSQPNTERLHSFSDGRFIPDALRKYTVPAEHGGDMVIQAFDGSSYVAIGQSRVHIKSPTVTIDGATRVDITAPIINLAGATVSITAPAGGVSMSNATIGGIPFGTHRHTGVQTGSGTSGGPTA